MTLEELPHSDGKPLREFVGNMPVGIEALPTRRGYPVPWFVAAVDGDYDFRVMRPEALMQAFTHGLCWVCGRKFLSLDYGTYVAGPMCGVNRTSAEPPSHHYCAVWSALNCPFLSRPTMVRRGHGDLIERGATSAGLMIERNPGVTMLWTAAAPVRPFNDGRGGTLFDIGPPKLVEWYKEQRRATRAEVEAAIESGLPKLREIATGPGDPAVLAMQVALFRRYLPK